MLIGVRFYRLETGHVKMWFKDANAELDKLSSQNLSIIRKWNLSILKLFDVGGRKMSLRRKRVNIGMGLVQCLEDILKL